MTALSALLFTVLIKGTLALLLTGLGTRLLRRQAAALQHLLWLLTLLILAGLPLLSVLLPSWPVHIWQPTALARRTSTPVALRMPQPLTVPEKALPQSISKETVPYSPSRPVNAPFVWTSAVLSLWLAGMGISLLRFAYERQVLQRLRRHSLPVTSTALVAMTTHIASHLSLSHPVVLLTGTSEQGNFSPMTWGWRQVFVLLPAESATWSQARLTAALTHELAHIQRKDWLWQRFAAIVCAVYWFHPLAWLAARRLNEAAERACDDVVLMNGMPPAEYAWQLLAVAQSLRSTRRSSLAALPLMRHLPIEARLCAVLEGSAQRRLSLRQRHAILGSGIVCLLALTTLRPVLAMKMQAKPAVPSSPSNFSTPIVAVNNKATLPDGATIELLGFTDGKPQAKGSPDENWWAPDGTRIHPLSAPSLLTTLHKSKQVGSANRGFLLRTSGFDSHLASLAVEFTPTAVLSSILHFADVRLPSADEAYHIQGIMWFTDTHRQYVMRVKAAYSAWQVTATAEALQTTVSATDGTKVTFLKSSKDMISTQIVTGAGRPKGEAIGVRIRSDEAIADMPRRVVAVDDKNKVTVLDQRLSLLYTKEQGQKDEYDMELTVPRRLQGHIRKYQLQTRPYQWVEFPHVHLEPGK